MAAGYPVCSRRKGFVSGNDRPAIQNTRHGRCKECGRLRGERRTRRRRSKRPRPRAAEHRPNAAPDNAAHHAIHIDKRFTALRPRRRRRTGSTSHNLTLAVPIQLRLVTDAGTMGFYVATLWSGLTLTAIPNACSLTCSICRAHFAKTSLCFGS
jgi:hypothetical protein